MEALPNAVSTTSIPVGSSLNSNPGDLKPSINQDQQQPGVQAPPVEGLFGVRNVLKKSYCAVLTVNSAGGTGNKSVTGVPFSPKAVSVQAVFTGSGAAVSFGSFDGKNNNVVSQSSSGAVSGSNLVYLKDSAGALQFRGTALAFTSDGIIINFDTTTSGSCYCLLTFLG